MTARDGLGLRWSFMGPFETIDLNAPGGVADYCARYSGFYEAARGRSSAAARPCEARERRARSCSLGRGAAPERGRAQAPPGATGA